MILRVSRDELYSRLKKKSKNRVDFIKIST